MCKLLITSTLLITLATIIKSTPYVAPVAPIEIVYGRINELLYVDLEKYITGYNVTHELVERTSSYYLSPRISAFPKIEIKTTSGSAPKIISRFFPQDKLGYVNQSELIIFLTDDLHVYYSDESNFHTFVQNFKVTDAEGVSCFGVTYINNHIIVDCLTNYEGQQINQLYIFNASDPNDSVSIPSNPTCKTAISNRTERGIKTFRFKNGSIYVYRYQYKSASLDCDSEGLVEIWQLNSGHDMTQLCTIKGEVFKDKLELSGMDVYLGDLFLLTTHGSLYRVSNYHNGLTSIKYLELQIPLQFGEELLAFKVFAQLKNQVHQLMLVIASLEYVYVVDWAAAENPYFNSRYKLDGPSVVKSVTFTKGFIYCLVSYDNFTEKVTIFHRGSRLNNLIFGYIDIEDSPNSYMDSEFINDNLIISSGSIIRRYFCQYPFLWFLRSKKDISGNVLIRSTSYSGDESMTIETVIPYAVVLPTDQAIYFDKPYLSRLINANHPSVVQVNIDQYVSGPFVKFKVSDSLAKKTKVSAKNYVPVSYNLKGFDTTDIIYHKIFSPSGNVEYSNYLWLFVQNKTRYLTSLDCLLDPSLNLNCKPHASIFINGTVKKIEFFENILFVLLEDKRLHLLSLMMDVIDSELKDDCADIISLVQEKPNMLICMQPKLNRFAYLIFKPSKLIEIQYIDQSHFSYPVVLLSVVVEPWLPSLLFINNNNTEVLIADVEILVEFNEISVIDRLSPVPSDGFDLKELRFLIVQERLIFFSNNNLSKAQEWYIGFSESAQASYIKTYTQRPDVNFNFNTSNGMYSSDFLLNFYISSYDQNFCPQITVFSAELTGNDNFIAKIPLEQSKPGAEIFLSGAPLNDMKADLIVASTETELRFFVVYDQARLTFLSFMSNSSASQESTTFELEVFNNLDVSQFNLTFELITYNTQLEIVKVTDKTIITDLIDIGEKTKNKAIMLPLDKYFNGTILFYTLKMQQAQDHESVFLKTKVALHGAFWTKEHSILDIKKGNDHIIIQAEKGLVRVETKTHRNCTIMPAELVNASCKLVVIDKTRHFAISLCYFTEYVTQYAYLIGIKYSDDCAYNIFLNPVCTNLIAAEAMRIRDGMLFLLENQFMNDKTVYARIHVWNFTDIYNHSYSGYVDQINFNVNYLDSRSFDVLRSGSGWRIFVIDALFGIRSIIFSNRGFHDPCGLYLANTTAFKKLRIRSNIIWTGISSIQQWNDEVFDLIVTAKNYNSYYIRMSLKANEEYLKVIRGYYHYPNFYHESKISVNIDSHQAYFAINAMHMLEGRSIILLYNISDVVKIRLEDSIPPFKYDDFIDYTPFREDNLSTEAFAVTSVRSSDSSASLTSIWARTPSKTNNLGIFDYGVVSSAYCAYDVHDYVQIVIQSADIHSTSLYLEVGNDKGSQEIEILINNSYMNPRARLWFIILSGILVGAALIIFAIIKACYPRDEDYLLPPKKQKSDDDQIAAS